MAARRRLATRYADYLWWTIADARTDADCGYTIAPLDLNALQPIPRKILRAGWRVAGHDWCWQHWGTCCPLRKVTFEVEHRRQRDKNGIDVVAVYKFMSADWSPWRALRAWRRKWPELHFDLALRYDQDVQLLGRANKVAA